MAHISKTAWTRRAAKVFNAQPRVAGGGTVWIDRRDASDRLDAALQRPTGQVCLDGPSGVGKTSLALNYLAVNSLRHVRVLATGAMTWPDFCRRLVSKSDNVESSASGDLELGIDKALPVLKLRISLGAKGRPFDDINLIDKIANTWTEHEVAERLAELDATLVIDDLERANEAFISRISDLCKLLTQGYVSENRKLILIGSGDIFRRLHASNESLDERLSQVSLGGIQDHAEAVRFIVLGLDSLELKHPWNSTLKRETDRATDAARAIWEAADGLPKSINAVGFEIARLGHDRTGVTVNDISNVSLAKTTENWRNYGQRFPEVLLFLETSPAAVALMRYMYHRGISDVHDVDDFLRRVERQPDAPAPAAVNTAIDELVRRKFLFRTGKNGERIFVRHPAAAHTLGVVLQNPRRFESISDIVVRNPLQLPIPFHFDNARVYRRRNEKT